MIKILFVYERYSTSLRVVKEMLEKESYVITEVFTTDEAIKKLKKENFSIIVSDITFRHVVLCTETQREYGVFLAEDIRKRDIELCTPYDVPIIFIYEKSLVMGQMVYLAIDLVGEENCFSNSVSPQIIVDVIKKILF